MDPELTLLTDALRNVESDLLTVKLMLEPIFTHRERLEVRREALLQQFNHLKANRP